MIDASLNDGVPRAAGSVATGTTAAVMRAGELTRRDAPNPTIGSRSSASAACSPAPATSAGSGRTSAAASTPRREVRRPAAGRSRRRRLTTPASPRPRVARTSVPTLRGYFLAAVHRRSRGPGPRPAGRSPNSTRSSTSPCTSARRLAERGHRPRSTAAVRRHPRQHRPADREDERPGPRGARAAARPVRDTNRDVDPLNRHATGLPAALRRPRTRLRARRLRPRRGLLPRRCTRSSWRATNCWPAGPTRCSPAGCRGPTRLYTQMGFAQLRALSPTGRCSPFDAQADGLVVGEGGCAFVLKRLADALAHGDTIHGVIAGIGLSNDVGRRTCSRPRARASCGRCARPTSRPAGSRATWT